MKSSSLMLFCAVISVLIVSCAGFAVKEAPLPELKDPGSVESLQTGDTFALWSPETPGIRTDIPAKMKLADDNWFHIFNPTIEVVAPQVPNGAAIVICPGGGYSYVCAGKEGTRTAAFFAEAGYTCFVLRYRLPQTGGAEFEHPASLADVQRAIKMVRFYSDEWGFSPDRIGVMGFSAGGHLASMAMTLFDTPVFSSGPVASVSPRPDFAVLVYPVINSFTPGVAHGCASKLVPEDQLRSVSSELNVSSDCPPALLIHAEDDRAVVPQNSILMRDALEAAGVKAVLKLYRNGGHGFGPGRSGTDSVRWNFDCLEWLSDHEF